MADAMNNRDRVIDALECCINFEKPECHKCPEGGPGFGFACRHHVMAAALALLKAQQPRVMAREEVSTLEEGAVAWLEERYEKAGKSYVQPMMSNGQGMMIGTHLTVNPARMSWKGRRFWTARPTEEQRGAEAWQ